MHYISVSNGFGRHNQDNMYRWETAGYLNWSNALAGDILGSPEGANSVPAVQNADRQAKAAKVAFERWDYLGAARNARMAYVTLKEEADRIGMTSPRWPSRCGRPLSASAPRRTGAGRAIRRSSGPQPSSRMSIPSCRHFLYRWLRSRPRLRAVFVTWPPWAPQPLADHLALVGVDQLAQRAVRGRRRPARRAAARPAAGQRGAHVGRGQRDPRPTG